MANLVLPYPDFVNGTAANGDQVDADLAAIVSFLLTYVPHTDGTNAFTGLPVLPATAPGATNAARRDYVDTAVASRVKSINPTGQVYQGSGYINGTNTDASGLLIVSFGVTFPNAPYCIICQITGTSPAVKVQRASTTTTQFQVAAPTAAVQAVSFDWLAFSV